MQLEYTGILIFLKCNSYPLLLLNDIYYLYDRRFAEGHNCENLEKVALSYVHRHFPQVCESEEFLDTPKDIVVQFFESEHVKVDSEFQVSRLRKHACAGRFEIKQFGDSKFLHDLIYL